MKRRWLLSLKLLELKQTSIFSVDTKRDEHATTNKTLIVIYPKELIPKSVSSPGQIRTGVSG